MALILDTSAVIGWMELKDPGVIAAIRAHSTDESPRVHAVTLGELERGVSQGGDATTRDKRRATLRFAREQLAPVALDPDGDQPEAFGMIGAVLSRAISHNDCWIVAAAVTERRRLLTQDTTLAERVSRAGASVDSIRAWLDDRSYSLEVVHVPRTPV